MISVTYRAGLAELTGCRTEQMEAGTIREVLAHIKSAYGKQAYKQAKCLLITVDQKSITMLNNWNTSLPAGCTVDFLTVSGGG